ncbi:FecR family protein [Leptospira borgpetersenii]|uniref:Sigma factor regulatory protein, FecR/PupR family n=4 Tax=Leptospira borgpetersenii TaxID=174 RepID=M3F6R1_LEPBO|nr:FecR domain-containing protein [Leptospira borgpetersenii]EMF97657.1 sigma factor regulatory protein, FecR/PupR family [Leptospira borgpetersenii str. 200701203]EMO08973.1 sigma factor regulatory protein, FecR/PupR family [Leptospira borgpetersenii str. Noumea 25]ALO28237.1 sigma factor regulatory protein, FecR/PupR family [Leptospira borgpetersenii serovar Ballum]ANH02343.1 LipL45-related lipoprotein [Leptospira borgpetersenii str. 4E]AXX17557.1 iron dicitrate transport regulator FecR [Lep
MKKISMILIVVCVSGLGFHCGKNQPSRTKGVIAFIKGDVSIQRGEQSLKATVSQEILNGDIVVTGSKSVASLDFGGNSYLIEVQSDSRFQIKEEADEKTFFQDKGSTWILTNKLVKGERMSLHTPTTTAGVRGTKFYTSVYGDMTFICHCAGHIELENRQNHTKKINDSDYLSVTKGDKTIYITPSDLQKLNVPYVHNHSEIEDSPLGGQNQMTFEQLQIINELAKKKLESL